MLSDIAALYARRKTHAHPATIIGMRLAAGSPTVVPAQYCGQLVCLTAGIAVVRADSGSWLVLPGHAAWLGPGVEHEVRLLGGSAFRAFVEPSASTKLLEQTGVVAASPLLRELVVAVARLPSSRAPLSLEQDRLLHLLVDEIAASSTAPAFSLPRPRDPRLWTVCTALRRDPACADAAPTWAARVGVSAKTLHLLFRRQTGLSFVQWRQRARLFRAVDDLVIGSSVDTVARICGYAGPSAFTAVFRRHFGILPSRLLA